jgi:polyisoprenoid-binding protein YceI
MTTRLLTALLLCLAWGCAHAKPQRYELDPVHTQVLFFVSHLGFSYPMGRFPKVSGTFTFDPDDWSSAKVEATIDVASLYLGDEAWEKKMLSDRFFDVKRHPTMTFVGERVEQTGERNGVIHGTLTLRGVSRPVDVSFRVNRIGRHSFSFRSAAGFSGTARIRRSDFGMRHLLPAVGDTVDIRLEVEGLKSRGGARRSDRGSDAGRDDAGAR